MARPITWPTKIRAPAEALEVYAAIARAAQAEGTFKECHIFEGARNKLGVPVIASEGTAHAAPTILGGYFALPLTGRRLCSSDGCINPFHYALAGDTFATRFVDVPELKRESVSIEDLMELVSYVRDKNDLRACTMEEYRKYIPEEDMPDESLKAVFEAMPAEWKA